MAVKGLHYDEAYDFSKLQFSTNDFRLRAIELHDLKTGGCFFRIHHADTAPAWLSETMSTWPWVRTNSKFGTNFDGDPLEAARALARLLSSKS